MWHDSVCNTVQESTVTSTIVAKKPAAWRESGFPSEFLDQRLEAVGCNPLGSANENRLLDAQAVLESPFPKMPLIAREVE